MHVIFRSSARAASAASMPTDRARLDMPGCSKTASAEVEELVDDCPCYLIRNCLDASEQTAIYQDILHRSKHTDNRSKPCMQPTPRTIIFDDNQSMLKFTDGDNIYNDLIVKTANDVLRKEEVLQKKHPKIRNCLQHRCSYNNNERRRNSISSTKWMFSGTYRPLQ